MPLETMADHYAQRPKRRRLAYALRRKRTGYNHFWEQAYNEVFIFGQLMFDWATPTKLKNQMPFFTALFIMVGHMLCPIPEPSGSSTLDSVPHPVEP